MGYTHGRMWDEQMIEDEIWKVVNTLGINHFPTHSEMESLLGGKALACKVSKYRGSVYWANRLNLPIKESETAFGNRFELKAMNDILINTGLDSVPTTSRHPYDLLVDRSVKIDVKVAKESKNGNGVKFYRFNIEKEKPTCDIFILYCVDNDETYKKILIVPSCIVVGQKYIGVSKNSKWDKYKDKWSYITQYAKFFAKYKN